MPPLKRMIIVAAGQGTRLRPLTDQRPKCMVSLAGRPLIHWQLDVARSLGIEEICVVTGYQADRVDVCDVEIVINSQFAKTNMAYSLWCAEEFFEDGFIMGYGDIVYNPEVLEALQDSPYDISVAVDRNWQSYWESRHEQILEDAESLELDDQGRIQSIGQPVRRVSEIQGQYIGLVAWRGKGLCAAKELVARERSQQAAIHPHRKFAELYITDLLQALIQSGQDVWPAWIEGGWLEIDSVRDLELAKSLISTNQGNFRIQRQ